MLAAAEELNALMQKHGTDKGTPGNSYQEYYASLFNNSRIAIKGLLEIGVYKGASLLLWREWFPMAKIIGLDIYPAYLKDFGDRITTEYCDQSSEESLKSIAEKYTNLDIIIDDGSHVFAHQIVSFNTLFPCLRPGGWYVIEDTFLTDKWEGEAGKIFYKMQEISVSMSRYKAALRSPIAEQIYSITFFDSLIAIQRKETQ